MAEIVRMPKMSDSMTEGVIAKWHKKVGDTVKSGELMAEIETDKATMDYESFNEGTILYLGANEGQAVKINYVLAIVGKKGEDYTSLLSGAAAATTVAVSGGSSEPPKATVAAVATAEKPSEKVDTSGIKAEIVLMPKMSDTMTDGVIAAWHKKIGDTVKSGELMAEIETDKATMEYESYTSGTVLYLGAKEKEAVPVNGVLAIVGDKNADWQTLLKAHQSGSYPSTNAVPVAQTASNGATPMAAGAAAAATQSVSSNGRMKASPLAKKMAKDLGYDISKIQGTGENGRVTRRDVENYKPSLASAVPVTSGSKGTAPIVLPQVVGKERFERTPVSQMSETIARRLAESKLSPPHC